MRDPGRVLSSQGSRRSRSSRVEEWSRISACSLRCLRPRPARRVLLQREGLLSVLRRSAHGGHGRPPRRSRPARGAGPAMGAHASLSAPVPLCLERAAHERCLALLSAGALRGPATAGEVGIRHSAGPVRLGHVHPALRLGAEPDAAFSCARARRGEGSGIGSSRSTRQKARTVSSRRSRSGPAACGRAG